ncbi:hypothetical protein [Acidovorax sp.]|uniref:hypothetical protein n=1 Tax=Acidovorax sp. TaxID=1872122 RepID=UPI00403764FE
MSNLAQATAKVVEIISAFSSEERLRIVRASLTLLGDEFNTPPTGQMAQRLSDQRVDEDPNNSKVHSLAQQWMRKNGLKTEQLEHYFHFDQGHVVPIALLGGATSKREQTINAYITVGIAHFLASGEASFTDADARRFCEQSGCYDGANHAKSITALKNRVTGSKSTGWKLTSPGLTAGADLIKQPKN